MLTEDEKTHLKEEETFRYEVRKSLKKEEKKAFWPRIWELANSAFGLWLLSTVVVGLIVSMYGNIKAGNEAAATNTENRRKLETEISSRLQIFRISLLQLSSENYYKYSYVRLAHRVDGIGVIDQGSVSNDGPIFVFPEYKDRPLQSLLFEMEHLTKGEKGSEIIKDGRLTISRIQNTLRTMPDRPATAYNQQMQYIQQSYQMNPNAKRSPQDSLLVIQYNQQTTIYNQQLVIYQKKIKVIIDSLGKQLVSNAFLRKEAND